MRLTLVERQEARLRCVPDLGLAYLIGQCRQEGVKVSLVQGSPKTLDCLLDDSVFDIFAKGYKDVVRERGEAWFKEFLRFSHGMAISNNIWDKTNPEALEDLWGLLTFMRDNVWPQWLPDYLFNEIEKTKPDVVGFSLWDFYENPGISAVTKSIIERLKQDSHMRGLPKGQPDPSSGTKVRVLVGGPGTVTQTARNDILDLFNPDYIVHHEGEGALVELLDMIEKGAITDRPNISYKGHDAMTKPIDDLNSLALPDFSDYDLDEFFLPVRALPLMTARGCDWARCAFCNHYATYKGYRELSPERVQESVEYYKQKYKTELIMLHDETLSHKRARALVEHLPDAYYYSYAYPSGYDKDLLKRMYDKGFRVLVWGVESGSQGVLNRMRKGTSINQVERILKDAHSVGITNVAFIMFGFPGETKGQAEETVDFLKRNAQYIERHATTLFRLAEDSPIWNEPENWGVKKLDAGQFKVEGGMKRDEVRKFLKELNKRKIKTSADTKYYMPGDSEFRPYLFMQVVYGEQAGEYPVRNGILVGNEIWPSLLMKDVSRPKLSLDDGQLETYEKCDGKHKLNATEFEPYPYVVFYRRPFN